MFLLLKDFSFLAILRWNINMDEKNNNKQQQFWQSAFAKQTLRSNRHETSLLFKKNISNTGEWTSRGSRISSQPSVYFRQNDGGWRKINSSKTMRRFPLPPGRLAPWNWHNRDHELTNLADQAIQMLSSWWFQPIWKICSSNWIISPSRGENKKYLKPPPIELLILADDDQYKCY